MDASRFLLTDLYDAVGNKSKSDTVRNAVAESHEQSREKCRNSLGEIIPLNLLKC